MVLTQMGRVVGAAELRLRRSGIRFRNVTPDRVRLEVELENHGATFSQPTSIHLRAAPFGAFVPWKPLATVAVPSIEAGGTVVVSTEARAPEVSSVGDFADLVPPAVRRSTGAERLRGFFRGLVPRRLRATKRLADEIREDSQRRNFLVDRLVGASWGTAADTNSLPPDLLRLLGRESPHWVGNIDVLVGAEAVERHMARALRIYPGRANLAYFMLGGDATRYDMRIGGDAAGCCEHALYEAVTGASLRRDDRTFVLEPEPWSLPCCLIDYVCRPPEGYERGNVEVHVQRQPGGDTAVVEFGFAADAPGTGCYAV